VNINLIYNEFALLNLKVAGGEPAPVLHTDVSPPRRVRDGIHGVKYVAKVHPAILLKIENN